MEKAKAPELLILIKVHAGIQWIGNEMDKTKATSKFG